VKALLILDLRLWILDFGAGFVWLGNRKSAIQNRQSGCTLPSAECVGRSVVSDADHAQGASSTLSTTRNKRSSIVHTRSSCWEDSMSRGWMPRRCVPMKDVA
jgi:hypothetical protein